MTDIAIGLDRRSQMILDCLVRELGRDELYRRILEFFARRGQIVAGAITKRLLSGQLLGRRTGALARSITGFSTLVGGLPGMRVGVIRGPSLAYAGVQEYGTKGENPASPFDTIKPKRAKALAVPVNDSLTPAGVPRFGGPREYPGELVFIPILRGAAIGALYDERDLMKLPTGASLDDARAAYLLLRKVDIKPKHYLRDGFLKEIAQVSADFANFLANLFADCRRVTA